MADRVDLLVVGAGIVGLSAAWRAAQRGLSVAVVERSRPGAGASTAAAGLLAPIVPAEWLGERGAWNLRAMGAWEGFARELEEAAGLDVDFRRAGSLRLAFDDAERAELDAIADAMAVAGVEHARLDEAGVVAEEPGVRHAIAGLLAPAEAHVATDRLVAALAVAAERAGVRIATGVEPAAALREGEDALAGVRLSDGTTQPATLTLLATGAWASQATWLPEHARPAVRPLAGEYLLLRGAPVCRRPLRCPAGSVTPRDGGVVWAGTTVRDAGYETRPSIAAIQGILAYWTRVLPAVAELGIERVGIGLRPATPDGHPIVGPGALPGLAIAAGHGREGITHAPLAAEAVAALAATAAVEAGPHAPRDRGIIRGRTRREDPR